MVFGQLETDQQFERRPLNRCAHFRIGQRIKRCIGIASFTLAGDLFPDIGRQRRFGPVHKRGGLGAGGGAVLTIGEIESHRSDSLGYHGRAAAQHGREIGKLHTACALNVCPPGNHIEAGFRINPIALIIAGGTKVCHRSGHIKIGQRFRGRAAEKCHVASIVGDADSRTSGTHGSNAGAAAFDNQLAISLATRQRESHSKCGQETKADGHVGGIPRVFVFTPLSKASVP